MTTESSRRPYALARLLVLAAGWAVTIATTYIPVPVETASTDVTLAVGPAAPSAALVEVAFLGAFVGQPKFVCAFVPNGDGRDGRYTQVGVLIEVVTLDANATLVHRVTPLADVLDWELVGGEYTTRHLATCAQFTCEDASCGGRLMFTLVDLAVPEATAPPDPTRLDPLDLELVVAVDAAPGALPGEALITLVETLP